MTTLQRGSTAEQTLAAQLEQAGIPFEREYRFADEDWCREQGFVTPTGRPKKWRSDFMILRPHVAMLLIEVDGGTWISGRHNRGSSIAAEYEKGAAAAILGYRTLHCTTEQVEDGTALGWIRAAIRAGR